VKRILWTAPQFQNGKRMLIANHGGRRLSVQLVRPGWWRAYCDGRDLGCWSSVDRAKQAAEKAIDDENA
jgi:hypothetical protein